MAKYAAADAADLLLRDRGSTLTVVVRDNGRGFHAARRGGHAHGLDGMRHRVESAGGQLTVESSPGRGTCICATLPKRARPGPAH